MRDGMSLMKRNWSENDETSIFVVHESGGLYDLNNHHNRLFRIRLNSMCSARNVRSFLVSNNINTKYFYSIRIILSCFIFPIEYYSESTRCLEKQNSHEYSRGCCEIRTIIFLDLYFIISIFFNCTFSPLCSFAM
jgi:hypothetical protein